MLGLKSLIWTITAGQIVAYITFVTDSQTEFKCNFTFKYSNQVYSVVETEMNTALQLHSATQKNLEESL